MKSAPEKYVGIDVGGPNKGFHVVAISGHKIIASWQCLSARKVADWCIGEEVRAVAIDAPCHWSSSGNSRLAERKLAKEGISTFATPTRNKSEGNPFYDWMRNGMELYSLLTPVFNLFAGVDTSGPLCLETFPHSVACAIFCRVVPARPKVKTRRAALFLCGLDSSSLKNIDYVDAALCAVAAESLCSGKWEKYGDATDGYIILPAGLAIVS